jgi:uncharacterized phage-associated protein
MSLQNPFTVAQFFINKSAETGIELSPMKLIKMAYLGHGWHLGIYNEPLFSESVQAWKYGPVIESLYHALKQYGSQQIPAEAIVEPFGASCTSDTTPFLERIWDVHSKYTALQLATLTHQTGSPWYTVWHEQGGANQKGAVIPDELIKSFYKKKYEDAQRRTAPTGTATAS